jgi:hypothetical protein
MPSEDLIQYRIWCVTENAWVRTDFRLASEGVPTTCPHNTAHVIDPALTTVIEVVPPNGTYDADGNLATINEPRPGTEKYFYLPNLCDRCCWYENATQVTNQTLATSDQVTYTSGKPFWIDLTHGRVFKEDEIPNRDSYIPVIEVDTGSGWETKTEDSWGQNDQDYTIDYEVGAVVFNTPLQPSDSVRASFFHGVDSTFTIEPDPGKRLKVLYTEVQFQKDIVMETNIRFEIWGYDPSDPPNRIPYKVEVYKRLIDFFQESTGPFPVIPAFGGSGDRGISHDVITLPFDYQAYRDLKSSQGTQLRVVLENNTPLSGDFGNATFYCLSEDE